MSKHTTTLTIYRSPTGFRWKLIAANGRKLANGGEAYRRRIDAVNALALIFNGWMFRGPEEEMMNSWNESVRIVDETRAKK